MSISSVSAEKDNSGNFTDSNTLLDESDISAQDGYSGTFTDLKNIIDEADDRNIINLEKDYRLDESEKDSFINGIGIYKNITINGNNYTIDCNHIGRAFQVSGSLTLINVNIINGYAPGQDGGAIYNAGTVDLRNCSFNFNIADKEGGAISTYSMTKIYNCTFDSNSAGDRGGAIYCSDGDISIDNSIFTNNSAYTYAGALSIMNQAETIVKNSNFTGNIAQTERGGAIRNSGGKLLVIKSNFEDNEADNLGGAISSFDGAETTIIYSNFVNNRANDRGGALYTEGKLNISNSNFSNNKASYGGAISNKNNAKSIIANSTFKNNRASSRGGAIRNNGGQLDINDSTFDNNSAVEYGGAVSSFTDSTTEVYNSVFMSNSAGDRGGAIRNGGNLIVIDSIFEHNNSTNYGGAISSYVESNATIINSTFKSNNAESGGAIGTNGKLNIIDSKFIDNSANSGGAVTALDEVIVTINDSVFNNNIATNGSVFRFESVNADVIIENNSYEITGSNAPIFVNDTIINSNTTIVIIGNKTVNVELGDNLNLSAVVIIDGQLVYGYNLEFVVEGTNYPANSLFNGTYYAPFSIESAGDKIVNITNTGIKEYLTNIKTATLRMKGGVNLIISSDDIIYGDNATINVTLRDNNGTNLTDTVTITVNGKEYNVIVINGTGSITIPNLNAGNYTIEANFPGNENYTSANATSQFNVAKANTTIKVTADDITYGENVVITVKSNVNGNVTITVNGKQYNVTITNGTGSITIPGLVTGIYSVEANFPGNNNYNPAFANTTFKVNAKEDNSTDNPGNEPGIDDGFDINNGSNVKSNDNDLVSTNIKTGNPLVLLVLALFSLIYPIKRKK